ncbi:ParB-like protein [Comamonas guangdongensis]|uniref:ParB-like protein n=1 Tax=Comamonas guangdongensis TaxID=510515 RepID=A0ABV3ZZR0_9BURK
MPAQQHLEQVLVSDLRPTQMTVGAAEVAFKRAQWAQLKSKARARLLLSHWFPAVKGPKGRFFIVDHHHLGQALVHEEVESVWVMQLADLSELEPTMFWRVMEFHHWAHPYNEKGLRCEFSAIPRQLTRLKDDPYRSLAGEVRKAGGYAKDAAPYAEFLWADFFRPLFRKTDLRSDGGQGLPESVVVDAVTMARSPKAQFLPGWSGVSAVLHKPA